ncbi:MAG: TolB family protein, partial [Thermoleophilia bacterium]
FTRIFFQDITDLPAADGQAPPPGLMLTPDGPFTGSYKGQSDPAADGDLVVWDELMTTPVHGMGHQIHFTRLGDNSSHILSPTSWGQSAPDVSGSRVVWQDTRAGAGQEDIYMYDLATGRETPVTTAPGQQLRPRIDGDWVVWRTPSDSRTDNDIFARNVVTGEIRQITRDGRAVFQYDPVIKGDLVVYDQGSPGHPEVGVYAYDLSQPAQSARQISSREGFNLAIDRTTGSDVAGAVRDSYRVVWRSSAPGTNGVHNIIMLCDLSADRPTTQEVTGGRSGVEDLALLGDRIIWQDDRDGRDAIYQNRIGERAQELAERFAPHLYLHHEEYFQPRKVDIMVAGEGTQLMQRNGVVDFPRLQWPDLTLASLGQFSSAADRPENLLYGKYIDLPGNRAAAWSAGRLSRSEWWLRRDYVDRYNDLAGRPEFPEMYYARVARNPSGDREAIQYWIPYYFNNFANYHEGDWEMIQVDLDGSLQPQGVAFSQHTGSVRRSWDFVQHDETHPISFVGRGSHANYFAAGEYSVPVAGLPDPTDDAEAHEPIHEPLVEVLPNVSSSGLSGLVGGPYGWLAYQGAWGEISGLSGFDGPQGPAGTPEHGSIWDDLFTWYDGLSHDGTPYDAGRPYDQTYGSTTAPAEISLYDAVGNHVGRNAAGTIDKQIPGAEYLEIPELNRRTIIIHGSESTAGYRFVLQGSGVGRIDFTAGIPSRANNTSDTLQYLDVPVSEAWTAELDLYQGSDYLLRSDNEGDGKVDIQQAPDSLLHHEIDLNAPARVNDLVVAGTTSDTVNLSFTSPGDDGSAGTAQYYDIRYSKSQITEDSWNDAVPLEKMLLPQVAGSPESVTVTGLDAGTVCYFALKAEDEVLHCSPISNIVKTMTAKPSLAWAKRRVYWASMSDFQNRIFSVEYTISNSGSGVALTPAIEASSGAPGSIRSVTAMPVAVVDLEPGNSASVTLKYYVPLNIYCFTTTTFSHCRDDAGRGLWFPAPLP